jgi:hypothetical protein
MSPLSSLGHVNRRVRGPVRSCLYTLLPKGGAVLCVSGLALPRQKKNPAKGAGLLRDAVMLDSYYLKSWAVLLPLI